MASELVTNIYNRCNLYLKVGCSYRSRGHITDLDKRQVPPHPDDGGAATDILDEDLYDGSSLNLEGRCMIEVVNNFKIGYQLGAEFLPWYPADNRKLYLTGEWAYTYLDLNAVLSHSFLIQINLIERHSDYLPDYIDENRDPYLLLGYRRSNFFYENGWDRYNETEPYQKFNRWADGFVIGFGLGYILDITASYDGDDRWSITLGLIGLFSPKLDD